MTSLAEPTLFYDHLRAGAVLGPSLSESEVAGCEAILAATGADGWSAAWTAYGLATAYLETNHTMQPIRELGGPDYFRRMYDPKGLRPAVAAVLGNTTPGDGVTYAGRGYVQLTGRKNYARAEAETHETLVADPDLAMRPDVAAKVMVAGMREGWFTGRSLADYLGDPTRANFISARRIINGQDRADDIADFALVFLAALEAGRWG